MSYVISSSLLLGVYDFAKLARSGELVRNREPFCTWKMATVRVYPLWATYPTATDMRWSYVHRSFTPLVSPSVRGGGYSSWRSNLE